ncbi:hypothetical protein PTI45_04644 [Paenibacillus nuruki]|uniref:Protein kinase domain-containing protein n=1 Tax=Paenibacillus nuruki TaxID=1886670 RepID=A0A1E3KWT6_9BACL|nr:hypothetical protein [Paenibacillus nuruki]ODP26008.1 hypothetical protein PTI45_04644 [Paenibacillus nuruki]
MIKTQQFYSLPQSVQSMFPGNKLNFDLLNFVMFKDPHDDRSNSDKRAIIFMDDLNNLVYKEFMKRGKSDADITALLHLQGNPFVPKLYIYEKRDFLIMEKAPGESLLDLIRNKSLTLEELTEIRNQYEILVKSISDSGWSYVDFKLEHLFWDSTAKQATLIDYSIGNEFDSSRVEIIQYLKEESIKHFDSLVAEYNIL